MLRCLIKIDQQVLQIYFLARDLERYLYLQLSHDLEKSHFALFHDRLRTQIVIVESYNIFGYNDIVLLQMLLGFLLI